LSSDSRKPGSELFIVDNSDADWKVRDYLHDWCQISGKIDIANGCFDIGGLFRQHPRLRTNEVVENV